MRNRKIILPSGNPRTVEFSDASGLPLSEEHVNVQDLVIRDEFLVSSLRNDIYNPCIHSKTITTVTDTAAVSVQGPLGSVPTALDKGVSIPKRLLFDQALQELTPIGKQFEFARQLEFQCLRQRQVSRFKNLKFVSNDPNFSLVVFLAELKEVKKAIPGLRKHFKTLRKAITRSQGRAVTIGDLFAGGWLDWSFGTGAFIRDLLKLWKLFANMGSKYRDFVAGMGEVKGTSHIVELSLFPPLPHPPVTRRLYGIDWTFSEVWSVGGTHAREPYSNLSVSYKYYSDGMTGLFGRTKHALQNLGVVPDLSIAWDLIPLSFVLDWFVPVGEWLHRQRIDLYDVTLRLVGAGYGTRVTLRRDIKVTYPIYSRSEPVTLGTDVIGTSYTRFYQRQPVLAIHAPDELSLGGITFNKVLSGTALTWVIAAGEIRKKPKTKR